jgi:hypothetical protein
MENVSHSSDLPHDVTAAHENNDEAFLGDMLSLSQFNVGHEIGKGQFSQVHNVFYTMFLLHSFIFAILFVVFIFETK